MRPRVSEIIVTFIRFGKKRRLVLMFEWLTLWPTWADLPVNSHRRDMAYLFASCAPAQWRIAWNLGSFEPRTYNDSGSARQVREPGPFRDLRGSRWDRDLTPDRASAKRAEICFF